MEVPAAWYDDLQRVRAAKRAHTSDFLNIDGVHSVSLSRVPDKAGGMNKLRPHVYADPESANIDVVEESVPESIEGFEVFVEKQERPQPDDCDLPCPTTELDGRTNQPDDVVNGGVMAYDDADTWSGTMGYPLTKEGNDELRMLSAAHTFNSSSQCDPTHSLYTRRYDDTCEFVGHLETIYHPGDAAIHELSNFSDFTEISNEIWVSTMMGERTRVAGHYSNDAIASHCSVGLPYEQFGTTTGHTEGSLVDCEVSVPEDGGTGEYPCLEKDEGIEYKIEAGDGDSGGPVFRYIESSTEDFVVIGGHHTASFGNVIEERCKQNEDIKIRIREEGLGTSGYRIAEEGYEIGDGNVFDN